MYRASVNCKRLPWNKQGCCQSFLLILCWLFSLSLQYGWLLFCSRLLRDWLLFFVGNNSLTVAFTLFSQIMLLITYFIWKLFTHSTQNLFSILLFIAVLHSYFSLAAVIAEKLVQIKYISGLVSNPTPIVSACWACECNIGGAPPISSIPLSALGVLDGDGLCSSSVKHYKKSDFFQGSKPLKKVLKNLEKNYFKSSINPW